MTIERDTKKTPDASALTRDTLLVRRPEITIHVASSGEVVIAFEGESISAGEHAMLILDAFRRPRTFGEVAAELAVSGSRDFADLTGTIMHLAREGILVTPGHGAIARTLKMSWDSSSIHATMLRDTKRTDAFIRAIRETVTPDDVVVDIGTGTGILAIAAARAGAKRVYAIEASSMGDIARDMFDRNDLGDRIQIIRGWSTRAELPEKATVLVSETVGNEALGENIIETYLDAHARLLAPGAKLIPYSIRVYAVPCALPQPFRLDHLFCRENVVEWQDTFGIDFSVLEDAGDRTAFPIYLKPAEARACAPLGPAALVTEVDLAAPHAVFETTLVAEVNRPGRLDGFLLYFDLGLSRTVDLSTAPELVDDRHSWKFPIWVRGRPRDVAKGDRVEIDYRYRSGVATVDFD